VGARRAKKDPPSQGGWNIFHSSRAGADCTDPASYRHIVTSGDSAWFGWPKSDQVMADIADWYAAPDLAAEKLAIDKTNKDSMDFVTEIPTGFFLSYQAWRRNVTGVVKAPFPVFWGTEKS
jgi:peptide/nickel transport system substrate-binding protein